MPNQDNDIYEAVLELMATQAASRQRGEAGPSYKRESSLRGNMERPLYPANFEGQINYAEGTDQYDTKLDPFQEQAFKTWKQLNAPNDSGADYDLRGAFSSGMSASPDNGHWPDKYKKPNHPTFSNESMYAQQKPELAGSWAGDRFVPPGQAMTANPMMMRQFAKQKAVRREIQGPEYLQNWQNYGKELQSNFPLNPNAMQDPANPEFLHGAINAAMAMGPGILAGPKALKAPGNVRQAPVLPEGVKSPQDVWRTDNISYGAEGLPRWEIDDSVARLKPKAGDMFGAPSDMKVSVIARLKNLLDHPQLFENYPELGEIGVNLRRGDASGEFNQIGGRSSLKASAPNENELISILLHELQHGVQRKEGFSQGGNPATALATHGERMDMTKMSQAELQDYLRSMSMLGGNDPQWRAYLKLGGEVEARNVQSRFENPDFKRFTPEYTEDVPRKFQTVTTPDTMIWGPGKKMSGASPYQGTYSDTPGHGVSNWRELMRERIDKPMSIDGKPYYPIRDNERRRDLPYTTEELNKELQESMESNKAQRNLKRYRTM